MLISLEYLKEIYLKLDVDFMSDFLRAIQDIDFDECKSKGVVE